MKGGTMGTGGFQIPVLLFGIGATELLLIILVIVLLFGSRKIPEIARGLGRSMSEFKKGMREGEEESGEGEKKNSTTPPAPKNGSK
jgi:sec-independent protein translocase protein TatA